MRTQITLQVDMPQVFYDALTELSKTHATSRAGEVRILIREEALRRGVWEEIPNEPQPAPDHVKLIDAIGDLGSSGGANGS